MLKQLFKLSPICGPINDDFMHHWNVFIQIHFVSCICDVWRMISYGLLLNYYHFLILLLGNYIEVFHPFFFWIFSDVIEYFDLGNFVGSIGLHHRSIQIIVIKLCPKKSNTAFSEQQIFILSICPQHHLQLALFIYILPELYTIQ